MRVEARTKYICLKCGGINRFKIGTRFPICEYCESDIFLPLSFDDSDKIYDEFKADNPDLYGRERHLQFEEHLREQYHIFDNPQFDKIAYNKMLQAEKAAEQATIQECRELDRAAAGHPTIKCPNCGSKNTSKITALSKAVSVGFFGLFSQKVKHQFHCNSCGYEW